MPTTQQHHYRYCPLRPCLCKRVAPPEVGEAVRVSYATIPWERLQGKLGRVIQVYRYTALVDFPRLGAFSLMHGQLS